MPNPFFSIVIPAYNTVRHLSMCVGSLLAQSCGDFEIVLVDDASTDGTGDLAERLASEDGRIHVRHVPHGGASAARNAGIQAAAGEYVLFMDSDDVLVPDGLERIRAKLCGSPDMLWFGFRYRLEDGSEREGRKLADRRYAGAPEAVVDWMQANMMPISACNKVFRLSVIRAFGIAFREGCSFGEDRLFNLDYLKRCGAIVTSSDNLYVYIVRSGSASHRFVPGMLSTLLSLHRERLSALRPLCEGRISGEEWQAFSDADYIKNVKSAWMHLAGYYSGLTREQRERELRPYLEIRAPEGLNRAALGRRELVWFAALKAAAHVHSPLMLKLMMSVNSLISNKGTI